MSLLAFNGTCINSAMSDHFNFPWLFFKMAIKFKDIFSDHFLTCDDSVISTLVAKSGNKLTLLQVGILNLYTSYHALLIQAENEHKQQSISNSNLTEWSTIQGVIVDRIHTKSLKLVENEVRGQILKLWPQSLPELYNMRSN